MISEKLFAIMVCPKCHGQLTMEPEEARLKCETCLIAFPVEDGIPVMLIDEAIDLAPHREEPITAGLSTKLDADGDPEEAVPSDLQDIEAVIESQLETPEPWVEDITKDEPEEI